MRSLGYGLLIVTSISTQVSVLSKSITLMAGILTAQLSFAAQEPADTTSVANKPSINIKPSDFSISTSSIGVGHGSVQGFSMTIEPRFEYFVADRLALGIQTGLTTSFSSADTRFSLGPIATYHFWNTKSLSAYTGGSFIFNNLTRQNGFPTTRTLGFYLGANYNFSSWFGVGPRVTFSAWTSGTPVSTTSIVFDAINLYFYF